MTMTDHNAITLSREWPIEVLYLLTSVMDYGVQKPDGRPCYDVQAIANGVIGSNGSEYTATIQVLDSRFYILLQEVEKPFVESEKKISTYRIPVDSLRILPMTIQDVQIL